MNKKKSKRKKMYKKGEYDTVHTKLSFYLILISALVELWLGLTYINSTEVYSHTFGLITLMESLFAISGIFLLDVISGYGFHYPKRFRPIDDNTLLHIGLMFGAMVLIQIIIQIPLSVRNYQIAMAVVFASPAEEVFFRGLILTIFLQLGTLGSRIQITKKRDISPMEILGIILSSLLFMAIHVNYYENPMLMATVFCCGIILAVGYWMWRDLTSLILAHFLLNMIVVYQTFYMVVF